jgi:hypothetical protein
MQATLLKNGACHLSLQARRGSDFVQHAVALNISQRLDVKQDADSP